MKIAQIFFFKIIAPMLWLMLFAYAFASSGVKLAKAIKEKNFPMIWLYTWIILVGIYFIFNGAK
jgi:hypothetical protein